MDLDGGRWSRRLAGILVAAGALVGVGCASSDSSPRACVPSAAGGCGTAAQVCFDSRCKSCPPGTYNCNLDDQDGCEQQTPCTSRPTGCDPAAAGACGSTSAYCSGSSCAPCAPGSFNCDGLSGNGCERQGSCSSSGCVPTQSNACGSVELVCVSGACVPCAAGTKNCNGDSADGCEATTCQPVPACVEAQDNSCVKPELVCLGGSCVPCAAGRANCDGVNSNGCEGSVGCAGCQMSQLDSCASEVEYCDGAGQCADCPDGRRNCDGDNFNQCEIAAASCGSGASCKFGDLHSCGDDGQFCTVEETCTPCPQGQKNCDGSNYNKCEEVVASCDDLCDDEANNSCGSPDRYCIFGACSDCSSGTTNCDGDNDNGCEYPGNTPQAMTGSSTVNGRTVDQGIADHCSMTGASSHAVQVTTSSPTLLVFELTTTTASFTALSIRALGSCSVTNGCAIGSATLAWQKEVPAGSYLVVVASDQDSDYALQVSFQPLP